MKWLRSTLFLLFATVAAWAEGTLTIEYIGKNAEQFPIDSVRSIVFSPQSIVITKNNGKYVQLSEGHTIHKFDFTTKVENITDVKNVSLNATKANIHVYPNPTINTVYIEGIM